jgi:hypothetical protein
MARTSWRLALSLIPYPAVDPLKSSPTIDGQRSLRIVGPLYPAQFDQPEAEMDIPTYDLREDYDYVPVRRRQHKAPELSPGQRFDPDRDRNESERDERSPIRRRLESLKQRAANRA